MPSQENVNISGTILDQMTAYAAYIEMIPQESREMVAEMVFPDEDDGSLISLHRKLVKMCRATLTGHLPPVVAAQLMKMMEAIAQNVHLMHAQTNTPQLATGTLRASFLEITAQDRPKAFISAPTRERVKIEAEPQRPELTVVEAAGGTEGK